MRNFGGRFSFYFRNDWPRAVATGSVSLFLYFLALALAVAATPVSATPPEDLDALFKSAIAHHRQGDYAGSIPILKHIVQLSPRNYDANLLLGEDLLSSGNPKEALAPLRVASEVRPADGLAQICLAEAAEGLGDFSTASEALQSAVRWSDEADQFLVAWADFSLNRSFNLGRALRKTKAGNATMLRVAAASRPEGSEARASLLKQSAAADPEQRGIWGELGSAQLAEGNYSEAQESLKEAQQKQPGESETVRLEALFAGAEQRWPDAEKRLSDLGARSPADLKRVLVLWPRLLVPGREVTGKIWDCLRNQATVCSLTAARSQEGKGLSAKDLYTQGRWEQLIALRPAAEPGAAESLWLGVAFSRIGDCARAIPLLERGLKSDERAAGFRLQLCYASEGDHVVSQLRAKGSQAALHQLKGDMVLRLHDDAATAVFEYAEALKSVPKDPHLLARLADAYKQLGDVDKAKNVAEAAVILDSRESSALHTLAQLAMNERDYDSATSRLKQLLLASPNDDWTQVQLGVAYGQSGHPEEALRYLGPQLAAGYPDPKGALHAMLAKALRKLGREDEAKQAANQAARLANSSLENVGSGTADAPQ